MTYRIEIRYKGTDVTDWIKRYKSHKHAIKFFERAISDAEIAPITGPYAVEYIDFYVNDSKAMHYYGGCKGTKGFIDWERCTKCGVVISDRFPMHECK